MVSKVGLAAAPAGQDGRQMMVVVLHWEILSGVLYLTSFVSMPDLHFLSSLGYEGSRFPVLPSIVFSLLDIRLKGDALSWL